MKYICLFLFLVATLACGGRGDKMSQLPSSTPAFINNTKLLDSEFQPMAQSKWLAAQQSLATNYTDLWASWRHINNQPAPSDCYTGKISCDGFVPPDLRALNVAPRGVDVTSVADSSEGASTPNSPDPSGVIQCPDSSTALCYAYEWPPCNIVVPDSRPDNMGPDEMTTCVLRELGYDTSRR